MQEIIPPSLPPSIHPWLYSPYGPWPLFQFLNPYTVGRTPWTGDQPVASPLPAHRHPCLEWDSNPGSQRSSERRRFMSSTARPATVICPRKYHGVVFRKTEFFIAIAFCENHTQSISTFCRQNVQFFNVKTGDTYANCCV
jgi:hypothetical protein